MNFERLIVIFSEARISRYLNADDSMESVIEQYHANVQLSEAMIPTLHYFEICMRNKIDQMIKHHYSIDWLASPLSPLHLSESDITKIKHTTTKLRMERKADPSHDDIVAQMTFGFWRSFFHRKYDPIIWHRNGLIKSVFPHLLRSNRTRSYVEQKILKIKDIRNRIAHHEDVLMHKISIIDVHSMCYELISAMSLEALEMLKTIDRFPSVVNKLSAVINKKFESNTAIN